MLAYNVALYRHSDLVLLLAVSAFVLLGTVSVGLCCAVLDGSEHRPLTQLTVTLAAMIRRPHTVLAWLLSMAAAAAAVTLPVVGPSLVLFAPAAGASIVLAVNKVTRFDALITPA
jgi:hypothetical protein